MSGVAKNHKTTTGLSAWVDAFLIDRQVSNRSPNTIRFYSQHLKKFTAYCHAVSVFDVETINTNTLRRFLLWLESEGHDPGGIHCFYRSIKVFIRWWELETEPHDYRNLFKKVRLPKVDDTPLPPVPLEDVNAMVIACPKTWHGLHDTAMLLCLLDTGVRANEVLSMDVEDVRLRTGALLIRNGKDGKSRSVFIGKSARRALHRHLQIRSTGPIWTAKNGERLTYWGLRQVLRRCAAMAKITLQPRITSDAHLQTICFEQVLTWKLYGA